MQLATDLQLHWNCTSAWVFSCKFAAYSLVYSLKMVTGKCNRNIFIIYRVKLLIPPSNAMLKLLVILFAIKLYARINIFSEHVFHRSTSGVEQLLLQVSDFLISSKFVILDKPFYRSNKKSYSNLLADSVFLSFFIGIKFMQGWTATTRHGVTNKI